MSNQTYQTRTALGISASALIIFSICGYVGQNVAMPGSYFQFSGSAVLPLLALSTIYFMVSFGLAIYSHPPENEHKALLQSMRKNLNALLKFCEHLRRYQEHTISTKEEQDEFERRTNDILETIHLSKTSEKFSKEMRDFYQIIVENHNFITYNFFQSVDVEEINVLDRNLQEIEKYRGTAGDLKERHLDRWSVFWYGALALLIAAYNASYNYGRTGEICAALRTCIVIDAHPAPDNTSANEKSPGDHARAVERKP
ncbi:hypothetical protein [Parvularcula sp. LCG005]|uniref:hypothetical protein n=1 Tax=Parvularcula sp. LCG005 TaxID=3078805 RepID=UPI0029436D45|nr:hypothetical protein [Parvularcula sp. LCG005]WOI51980.1 hypothetical protein RUI03_07400 [Parvularcula sp. LCG005]